ncbi:MAG: cyclic-di-AMP receptor [Ndongobacter sp.]|nr:cyclic-di-AMP receptor [Ndongobacter sp.]
MKLLICIVQDNDVNPLMDEFVDHGYRVTKLSSTGGFLRSGNTTLLLGLEEALVEEALEVIDRTCKRRKTMTTMMNPQLDGGVYQGLPIEIEIGGATVFQLDVDRMLRF